MATLKQNHPGESRGVMTLFKNEAPDTVAFKVIAKPKDTPPKLRMVRFIRDHSANLMLSL